MSDAVTKALDQMRTNPFGARFTSLKLVCEFHFGAPRNKGTSHFIFKTPWPGDPRVNIQKGKGGKAKPYQVRQVLLAIDMIDSFQNR